MAILFDLEEETMILREVERTRKRLLLWDDEQEFYALADSLV